MTRSSRSSAARTPAVAAHARRPSGPSVRIRLALSYAGFLMVAGLLLIAVVWVFLLRYVPDSAVIVTPPAPGGARPRAGIFIPGRSDLWEAFSPKAALALGVLLVVGLVGGWLLAGRMLKPLDRITDAARAVGRGSLSHRIHLPGRRDEFREAADAFDGMLARLEAHVGEQQRFAANASHELRTPLAVTRAILDVAENDPDATVPDLVAKLRAVNDRAVDLTEALLLLSRADQRSFTPEPVDLALLAEEAAETLLPLAERRGVTLDVDGGAAPATGSPALLQQLVTNLVHNAIVHNLPDGGTVRVTTSARPQTAVLVVENTGEPLDPALVSSLTEPFQRGEGRTRTHSGGVGLGLAIVTSIARAHDGALELTPLSGGGLRVTVTLPA